MQSVNLNFLEPSGPLQACNGTALPFICGNVKEINRFGTGGIVAAVKTVESVSDRILYIGLRDYCCNIIVLNVHAPSEEKSGDPKDSFYKELEQVSHHFAKYHLTILLGDSTAKVRRENIFNPTIGNESLHQGSNDNGFSTVNFATSKNLVFKWLLRARCSHTKTFLNTPGPLLMGSPTTR